MPTTVNWIAVISKGGLVRILFWKVYRANQRFTALFIRNHTQWIRFKDSARPVYHMTLHHSKQLWIPNRIKDFRTYDFVDLFRCTNFKFSLQNKKKMHVWKTALLKLDRIEIGSDCTEYLLVYIVVNKLFAFQAKNTVYQIRTILEFLILRNVVSNLLPFRVASKSYK